MSGTKKHTVWNIIKQVFTSIIVAFAVVIMIFTIISVTTFDRNDRNIFGFKMFIVLSDSMSKTDFSAGDIVISKAVDPTTLQVGDIISYQSMSEDNFGQVVTHKIRELTTDAQGNPGFITYGTTTNVNDENVVTYPFVLGKYCGRIPKLGLFFQYLKTTPGYIICILIPFLLLIGIQGLNCIQIFKKYKKEQMEAMAEEKAKLEEERAESQRMMQELLALKAQLSAQNGGNISVSQPQAQEKVEEKAPETAPETDRTDDNQNRT